MLRVGNLGNFGNLGGLSPRIIGCREQEVLCLERFALELFIRFSIIFPERHGTCHRVVCRDVGDRREKMKSFVSVCALALVATVGQAAVIRVDTSPFRNGSGGEFKITPQTGFAGLTGLAADLSPSSFQSFCLEAGENVTMGQLYSVVINTGAMNGGVGGFDPLDERTAFLYTKFRNGTLSLYDYDGDRDGSAGALQKAIWFIEGESGGQHNAYVALANAAVAVGGEWYGMGIGNVRVLNLTKSNGDRAQDQLTIIPAPGTALLAIGGLLVARRRR